MSEHTEEKAQRQVAAVEAVIVRWTAVLAENKPRTDSHWITERSAMTLSAALDELRAALALTIPPGATK